MDFDLFWVDLCENKLLFKTYSLNQKSKYIYYNNSCFVVNLVYQMLYMLDFTFYVYFKISKFQPFKGVKKKIQLRDSFIRAQCIRYLFA